MYLSIFNVPPTLSHFSILELLTQKHAGALCSEITERERAAMVAVGEQRERERPSDFPTVFWVSLWLIISYQSFNLGARSGRFKP